jgi:hypothetical protein
MTAEMRWRVLDGSTGAPFRGLGTKWTAGFDGVGFGAGATARWKQPVVVAQASAARAEVTI